jgi:hypothetical protein
MDSPTHHGQAVKRGPGRPRGSVRKPVAAVPLPAPAVLPLPDWVLSAWRSAAGKDKTHDPVQSAFACGAALSAFDAMLRSDPPWLGALRMRQALKAACVLSRLLRLNADEAALRDALHLTRRDDDPGPAGRLHRHLRQLTARPLRFADETLEAIAAELGSSALALDVLPLLKADMATARQLGWSVPVLLHLTAVLDPALRQGESGRRPRADEEDWPVVQQAVLAQAVVAAHAEAMTLQRRATTLVSAANGLRTREGARGLALLMADESVAPWHMTGNRTSLPGLGSDRAARRFCETLAGLGALRLLTDRPTFRLYGL